VINRPALQTLLASLTGIQVAATTGAMRPQVSPVNKAILFYSLRVTGAGMMDEFAQTYNPSTNKLEYKQFALRLAALTLTCEAYPNAEGLAAYDYLERVRAGLRRPTAKAALRAAGVSLIGFEDATQYRVSWGDEYIDAASMDVRLHASSVSAVSDVELGDWIETINSSTEFSYSTNELSSGYSMSPGYTSSGAVTNT
jgi:hypothetical protein